MPFAKPPASRSNKTIRLRSFLPPLCGRSINVQNPHVTFQRASCDPMLKDAHGLTITTSSAEAAAAYDRTIASYLNARLDARDDLTALLKADPDFGLAQCHKGYAGLLHYKQAALPAE